MKTPNSISNSSSASHSGAESLQGSVNDYSDIIDLPRPESHHPKANAEARAGQFAPFAALVGYEELVQDTTERTLIEVENETTVEIDEFIEDLEISQDSFSQDSFSQDSFSQASFLQDGFSQDSDFSDYDYDIADSSEWDF